LDPRKLLWVGIGGSTIAVLCCATPIMMIALAAIGVAAVGAWLDAALAAALAGFLALTGFALWKIRQVQP
jgi:mercuric ion transport protein